MASRSQEQDQAAGGTERRELRLADGTIVIASIAVRSYTRTPSQLYGYLQFKVQGKTVTKYVGRVTADTKQAALHTGWTLVQRRKVAEAQGWAWVKKTSR